MSQIVIAYAREDVAVAHALKQSLERRHYDVFLDVDGRIRGDWRQYIAGRIRRATDLVVLVSPHAWHSPDLADEVQVGIAHARHLVPVLLGEPADRSTDLPARGLREALVQTRGGPGVLRPVAQRRSPRPDPRGHHRP